MRGSLFLLPRTPRNRNGWEHSQGILMQQRKAKYLKLTIVWLVWYQVLINHYWEFGTYIHDSVRPLGLNFQQRLAFCESISEFQA